MDNPYQPEEGRDLAPIQRELADKCIELSGIPYWNFTNCGTDSLQIAVHALTKEGDTILVPAYGWRCVANAVRFMNRKIKFIDIDKTGNMCPKALKKIYFGQLFLLYLLLYFIYLFFFILYFSFYYKKF